MAPYSTRMAPLALAPQPTVSRPMLLSGSSDTSCERSPGSLQFWMSSRQPEVAGPESTHAKRRSSKRDALNAGSHEMLTPGGDGLGMVTHP